MNIKYKKKLVNLYFYISIILNDLCWYFHNKGIYLQREIDNICQPTTTFNLWDKIRNFPNLKE